MASQQVTISHAVTPYTCKVQGAITTHMPALTPSEGEQSGGALICGILCTACVLLIAMLEP